MPNKLLLKSTPLLPILLSFTACPQRPIPLAEFEEFAPFNQPDTKIIILGGHCEPTLGHAFLAEVEGKRKLLFEHPQQEAAPPRASLSQGDGRVPANSLTCLRPKGRGSLIF